MRQVVAFLANTGKRKYEPSDIFPLNKDLYIDERETKSKEDEIEETRQRGIAMARKMGLKIAGEDA
jgi:hypothetical protein